MSITVNAYKEIASSRLSQLLPDNNSVVYMCIGCDRVIADSLGPRVGTILQEKMKTPLYVYGLFNSNINAINLIKAHNLIKVFHPDRKIVVIDAAVGDQSEVGAISFSAKPLRPGSATNKNLPAVGDYSIMGIVAGSGLSDFYSTSYDKLQLVEQMAKVISSAILRESQPSDAKRY